MTGLSDRPENAVLSPAMTAAVDRAGPRVDDVGVWAERLSSNSSYHHDNSRRIMDRETNVCIQ